jgi:hypothetical protein
MVEGLSWGIGKYTYIVKARQGVEEPGSHPAAPPEESAPLDRWIHRRRDARPHRECRPSECFERDCRSILAEGQAFRDAKAARTMKERPRMSWPRHRQLWAYPLSRRLTRKQHAPC